MSKGWTVKVEVPVRFSMDCNVNVLGSDEHQAISAAKEFVLKHLELASDEEGIPWNFEMAGLSFARGGGTLSFDHGVFQYIVEPDPDFDPEEEEEQDLTVSDLIYAAQCLNEAFWHLPVPHPLMDWMDKRGVSAVRRQINLCAYYCEQAFRCMVEDEHYMDSFDTDFVPRFLENCVNDRFEPRSEDPKVLSLLWRGI